MTTPEELAQFLSRRLPLEWRTKHAWFTVTPLPRPDALATQLLATAEFQAFQLGRFLMTPDGELIEAAVGMITPPLAQPYVELVTEALHLAATARTEEQRRTAVGVLALALVLGAIAFIGTQSNRS